jgi:hypothetical protein
MAHPDRAPASLPAERVRLGQEDVERLAVAGVLAKLVGVLAQLGVGQLLNCPASPILRARSISRLDMSG